MMILFLVMFQPVAHGTATAPSPPNAKAAGADLLDNEIVSTEVTAPSHEQMSQLTQLLKGRAEWQAEKAEMAHEIATLTSQLSACQIDRDICNGAAAAANRRNLQQSSTCGIDKAQTMLSVCCEPGSGLANGHRRVQASGCDSLPSTCSLQCASQFNSIFENCQEQPLLQGLSAETMSDWRSFHSECSEVEQVAAQMTLGPAVFSLTLPPIDLEGAALSATMFATVGSGEAGIGPLNPSEPLPPLPRAESGARSVVDLMPTLLLPTNATYVIDLNYDVSPGEVRVIGTQDVTIRGAASLGRPLSYGGVNRAFWVTDASTLRLELIEISDRKYTPHWRPYSGGGYTDAIIRVEGRPEVTSNNEQQPVTVVLTNCVFARNPFRVLFVEHATAIVLRSLFSDNVATYVPLHGEWWERQQAPDMKNGMQGAAIQVMDRGKLHIEGSQFVGNGLRLIAATTDDCTAHYHGGALQGGAIVFAGSQPGAGLEISDSHFLRNFLEHDGCETMLADGGRDILQQGPAIYINNNPNGGRLSTAVPINISTCVFRDNNPNKNGAVWWQGEILEPCLDFSDVLQGRDCNQVPELMPPHSYSSALCTGQINAIGRDMNPIATTAPFVHGGRDICHVCWTHYDDSHARQCPAGSRRPASDDASSWSAFHDFFGRALDESSEPQDFGWWLSSAQSGEGRRLNLKSDDNNPTRFHCIVGGVDVGGINRSDSLTSQTFTGGTESSDIDRDGAGILGKTNEIEVPKHSRKSAAGCEDKCYDWSSIFPTPRTGQRHLGEHSDEVSNETSETQSDDNLDLVYSDGQDSKDNYVHSPTPTDCCIVIGLLVFLIFLVKTYGRYKISCPAPVVCIPGHALAARTAAPKSCWKGRRQSWAVSGFRRAFRKWQCDSVSVCQWRSNMILGGIVLFVLMFQPVAEGSLAAASVSKTVDQQQNLDMSLLAKLDVDLVLLQFIGNMVNELKEVKNDKMALQNRTQSLESELGQVKTVNMGLQNRAQILEEQVLKHQVENKAVYTELQQVKRDKVMFENKTQVEYRQEREKTKQLLITVAKLQNQTRTNSVRLDQCEADAHPSIKKMQASQRRRLQEEETLCRGSGMVAMFAACCPRQGGGVGHRRSLQSVQGCDALPETCSASCAPLFIEYFEGCQGIIDDLAPDQRQTFVGFYGGCQEVEQAAAAMLEDARPAMIFHVVVMSDAAAQQAQMFDGGSASTPPVGPIGPLPPSPSPAGGAEIAQEFRRVCTTANLTVCVPQCNSLTYGFLLSIEIDGRGTVMTCNKMGVLFSWQGQASLGGYIGDDFQAFFSSVVSGAAGTYMSTLKEDQHVQTELTIRPGQVVVISGDRSLMQQPTWGVGGTSSRIQQVNTCETANDGRCDVFTTIDGYPGGGGGPCLHGTDDTDCGTVSFASSGRTVFTVGEAASLSLSYIQVDGGITTVDGGTVSLDSCTMLAVALATALGSFSGVSSRLALQTITVSEHPEWGVLNGAVTMEADDMVYDPPGLIPAFFVVLSGPCTVTEHGRCVGRWPGGYLPNEACHIAVGRGGVLGPCPVFDTDGSSLADDNGDYVTMPDGSIHGGSLGSGGPGAGCPVGATLTTGQILAWHSSGENQGLNRGDGLPWSAHGPGGGWQFCFV